jgi:hypothetical protein
MENNNDLVTFKNVPYNYVKSELFGFHGWDKYILVEDIVLEQYLIHLINQNKTPTFFTYKIIYIGGWSNVIDLMNRNKIIKFFSSPENVISILDKDIENECKTKENVFFIPFRSVEKQLSEHYRKEDRDGLPEVNETYRGKDDKKRMKKLYEDFIFEGHNHLPVMTNIEIFNFINEKKQNEVEEFKTLLINFLNTS